MSGFRELLLSSNEKGRDAIHEMYRNKGMDLPLSYVERDYLYDELFYEFSDLDLPEKPSLKMKRNNMSDSDEYSTSTSVVPGKKVIFPSSSDENSTPQSGATGSSSSSCTASIKSSREAGCHDPELDDDDDHVAIYLRTVKYSHNYQWHVIKPKKGTRANTFLENILPAEPKNQLKYKSACVAVGSRIYVLGGLEVKSPNCDLKALDDVFYIDATRQWGGIWKEGPPLLRPLPFPFALSCITNNNNGKGNMSGGTIFASSYYLDNEDVEPKTSLPPSQVLSDGVWSSLCTELPEDLYVFTELPEDMYSVTTGHVGCDHHNGPRRILLHSTKSTRLYQYDTTSNEWAVACHDFGSNYPKASALVNGILYSIDACEPGIVSALDVSSLSKERKTVKLNYPRNKKHWWVPQMTQDGWYTDFFMVALGNHKLAFIWSYQVPFDQDATCIWCTKWKVSKADSPNGDYELTAISRYRYFSESNRLIDCLAMVWRRGGVYLRSSGRQRERWRELCLDIK